jgi:hypothetical protein
MPLTRQRLWKLGAALALFLCTLAVGNHFIPNDRAVTRRMLGHDFLVFYSGGLLARTGQYPQLYHMDTLRQLEHDAGVRFNLEMGPGYGPWWNPPHAAWLFAPYSYVDYPTALLLWQLTSAALFLASIALLARMLPDGTPWKTKALIPLLMLVSMPFLQAVSHGQNTFLTLFLLTATVTLWRSNHAYAAGLVCGLLAYKPQHAAVVGVVLTLSLGWRAAAGLATTGLATLLVTGLTMPGALHDFLFTMPANLKAFQETNHYMWERHMTFKGFWRLLLQGRDTGETSPTVLFLWLTCWLALATTFARALWTSVRPTFLTANGQRPAANAHRDRLITATIVATPLLVPFYFDYDMLLLAIPATLYAADRLRRAPRPTDARTDLAWTALFTSLELANLGAGHTRVSFTVLPLTALAFLLIHRIAPRRSEVQSEPRDITAPPLPDLQLAA